MSLEVELKAHVSDHVLLKQRIESLSGISSSLYEHKEDTYFSRSGESALFRMRAEQSGPTSDTMQGSLVFTYKNKAIKDGIEVNEEVEFSSTVDQGSSALAFFISLGYEIYITKTKSGYVYTYSVDPDFPLLTIELVEVASLGWFVEMEFILEDPSLVASAREHLLSVLDRLAIDRLAIEDQYYMHMLKKEKPEA